MKTYKNKNIPVVILGSAWTLKIVNKEDDPRFKTLNCDGFCDWSAKTMWVSNFGSDIKEYNISCPTTHIEHCIRHELVHAFMFESGLASDWEHKYEVGQDETTVDWIAWQLLKMHFAYLEITASLETVDVLENMKGLNEENDRKEKE